MNKMDGYRFRFIDENNGIWLMIDDLEEFETIELPSEMAITLAKMLGEQHTYRNKIERTLIPFEKLLEIVSKQDIDKDVLITCIQYGMDYIEAMQNGRK